MNPFKMIFNAVSGQSDHALYTRHKSVLALPDVDKQAIANSLLEKAFLSGLTDGYDLRLKSIELALKNGANPNLALKRRPTQAGFKTQIVYDMGAVGYGWPQFKETCLAAAVLVGNERGVRLLLEHGADPNGLGAYMGAGYEASGKRSALQIALITGRPECAKMLLQAGAHIDGSGDAEVSKDRFDKRTLYKGAGGPGVYPLVYAVMKKDSAMLKLLLENCREDLSDNLGAKLALDMAGKLCHVGMVFMLTDAMKKSQGPQPSQAVRASRGRLLSP